MENDIRSEPLRLRYNALTWAQQTTFRRLKDSFDQEQLMSEGEFFDRVDALMTLAEKS